MRDDHPVVVFTADPVMIQYTCPDGPHSHYVYTPAQAVAYCLCGWMFVGDFDTFKSNAFDVAYTLAKMQAREHLKNPLKGMTGE